MPAVTRLDFDKLARDIEDAPPRRDRLPVDYAQPRHRDPLSVLPSYVTHVDGVPEIGAMSAAAVVAQYEAAAKAIEAMGSEQKRIVKRCEEVIALALAAMEEATRLAERYREEGKKRFAEVENLALLTQEVSSICTAAQRKIAGDASLA
jgi:hypothetical protein